MLVSSINDIQFQEEQQDKISETQSVYTIQSIQNDITSIKVKEIQQIKAFSKPPELVKTVFKAVSLLLGQKQDWDAARKAMNNPKQFLKKLHSFDIKGVSSKLREKLALYVKSPGFTYQEVKRKSYATANLASWALGVYELSGG